MSNSKDDKRKISLFVIIVNGLLTAACVVWLFNLLVTKEVSAYIRLEIVTDIIASLVAIAYLAAGYSKSVAGHYKASMIIAAINALVVAVVSTKEYIQVIPIIMCAIACVLICALAFVKNMGKTISISLCIALVVIRIAGLISVILSPAFDTVSTHMALLITQTVLALMITVITYAKYADKAARNTI